MARFSTLVLSRPNSESVSEVRQCLRSIPSIGSISVMPDYFVDRFVRVDSIEELYGKILKKSEEGGGGSLRGYAQTEVKGGNAVNMAYALGKFGARVELLTIADSLPAETLRSIFKPLKTVRLHLVAGSAGFTTALEFVHNGRHVNVMVSDAGSVKDFSGEGIPAEYWDAISDCKAVCVLNWSSNKRGTELCKRVFSEARRRSGALTFFDPADPTELLDRIQELNEAIFEKGLVDVISLNDNESRVLARSLCKHELPQEYEIQDLEKTATLLSKKTGACIDLHTRYASLSCSNHGRNCAVVECHRVTPKTITGAGDIWDAADLLGYLTKMGIEARLKFANAAAGLYVSREDPEPPDLDSILEFMSS